MSEGKTRIGFIGLGLMGLPMVRRLLAAGCDLTIWNRSPEKSAAVRAEGAQVAASARALAEESALLFTCVSDTAAMEAVVFGEAGIAEAAGRGKLLVDHSSIHPEATRAMAARLAAASGMTWLDAPVSGGVAGAEAGTLSILAGGSREDFERALPFLEQVSARQSLLGAVGAGQTAKLCNQVIVGCGLAVIAEALKLASRSGIDPLALIAAMQGGFADSKPLQIFGPRMLQPVETPLAHIATVLKDVETALDVGQRAEVPLPMTARAGEIYRLLAAAGLGEAEFDALYSNLDSDPEPRL